MTVKETIRFGHNALRGISGSPVTDTKAILCHVLGLDRTTLQGSLSRILTEEQFRKFHTLLEQRQQSIPIAYITGHKEFYGIDFYVDHRVLIPRPETEQLVETALRELTAVRGESPILIDVGTGSGNIAVTLARLVPLLPVIATDVSKDAIHVARRNARNVQVSGQIDFRVGHLLDPIEDAEIEGRLVFMTANLPYVPARYQVMPDLGYEPSFAIFAGEDGLDLYRDFFMGLGRRPIRDLILYTEIHHDQAGTLREFALQALPGAKITVIRDYAGHDRLLRIEHRRLMTTPPAALEEASEAEKPDKI